MNRLLSTLRPIFRPWTVLKICLWGVTLVILFYAEEDWRGARAWAATKAKWAARGETFDEAKLFPPPIPDAQNLAAISLFRMEAISKTSPFFAPLVLKRAMRSDLPGNILPSTAGRSPDLGKIQRVIAEDYATAFKRVQPAGDTLAQFDALYPFIGNLTAASAVRPLCRFPTEAEILPPFFRSKILLTELIRVSQILKLHAILALNEGRSDLALADLETTYKLRSGVERDSTLYGGLIVIGMMAGSNAALADGLDHHQWSDRQLAELESSLGTIHFLADARLDFRGEAADSVANLEYLKRSAQRADLSGLFESIDSRVPRMVRYAPPWPAGWWDDNKRQTATFLFDELTTVDPASHRVFPKRELDLENQVKRDGSRWDATAPWNVWYTSASSILDEMTQKYAEAQVRWVDEARIACALERFHLTHGVYPAGLEALVPACIDCLPHDIINGQPYHYALRPDGSYLLYSVGWNEKDDGGVTAYEKVYPRRDPKRGDWVWLPPG